VSFLYQLFFFCCISLCRVFLCSLSVLIPFICTYIVVTNTVVERQLLRLGYPLKFEVRRERERERERESGGRVKKE